MANVLDITLRREGDVYTISFHIEDEGLSVYTTHPTYEEAKETGEKLADVLSVPMFDYEQIVKVTEKHWGL